MLVFELILVILIAKPSWKKVSEQLLPM
jgi:hypothetical protein